MWEKKRRKMHLHGDRDFVLNIKKPVGMKKKRVVACNIGGYNIKKSRLLNAKKKKKTRRREIERERDAENVERESNRP